MSVAESPASNVQEWTVSGLSTALKRTVEDAYSYVRLRGEISGFRGTHASGHSYFTLKDEKACIDAVVWRSTMLRLKFPPQEGLEVIVTGRVTTFPDKSRYQIVIDTLEPAGEGALMALLAERRKTLAAEGLFDEARKRVLPFLPHVIGVVTSPTGAVIRDILHRLADRFARHVLVWPVRVQGETSAAEIAEAIGGFNAILAGGAIPRPDLLIVARGGGSLEDLWGFNEEIVVRAVAASAIPVISAVGHETDWTLIDLVADHRAPTPTAAAERAVPVRSDLIVAVAGHGARLGACLVQSVDRKRHMVRALGRGLPRPADILALPRQRFDEAAGRLGRALVANAQAHHRRLDRQAARLRPQLLAGAVSGRRDRINAVARRMSQSLRHALVLRRRGFAAQSKLLDALGYQAVLSRGYALVYDADWRMVRRAASVHAGDALAIQFADGRVDVCAEGAASAPPQARPKRKVTAPSGQGTLL